MIEEIIEDLFGGFKMTKKRMAIIVVYMLGALFTNSYCRNCRWVDWDRFDEPEWPYLSTVAATVFWPVYVASRASDLAVAYASKVDVAVEWK